MSAQGPPQTRHGGYEEAIAALNTLQSNAAVIDAIRKSGGKLNDFALPEMVEYLERIGWKSDDLNRLNVIHITGTKGKGSTSAFVDSLVRSTPEIVQDGRPKVGLYTSPHLVQVRERIRLDGVPISQDMFAKYFWEVWDRLGSNTKRANPDITPLRPVYFRYLTILAYHIFLTLQVKCTILEVGIGGKYDSTNIVPKPLVTGITTLGLDHTALLGNTIEEIAVQKAGIFKKDVPSLSVWQQEGAQRVIADQASKVGVSSFKQIPELDRSSPYFQVTLGIPGAHQASNAQLAVEMYRVFLSRQEARQQFQAPNIPVQDGPLTKQEIQALEQARWPGRCQMVRGARPGTPTWFLDGAHTTESLESCAQWFADTSLSESRTDKTHRTLIFNTTHDRKSEELLRGMLDAIAQKTNDKQSSAVKYFDKILFCTNITYREGKSSGDLTAIAGPVSLEAQENMQRSWQLLDTQASTETQVLASIEEAVDEVNRDTHDEHHVLVCGSLHLVGGVMSHLKDKHLLDEALHGLF